MDSPFRAAFMSADTGGSATYEFQADSDLFHRTADAIVGTFMECMNERLDWERPLSYELNSAIKKDDKKRARLNCIHHLLGQVPYREINHEPVVLPERVHNPDYCRGPLPREIFVPAVY